MSQSINNTRWPERAATTARLVAVVVLFAGGILLGLMALDPARHVLAEHDQTATRDEAEDTAAMWHRAMPGRIDQQIAGDLERLAIGPAALVQGLDQYPDGICPLFDPLDL